MKEKSGSRKRTRSSPSSSSDTCKKEQSTSVLSRKPLEKSTPMSLDDQSSPASVGQTSVGFIIPKFILNYVFANVSKTGFFIYLSVLCGLAFAADWREFPELFFFKTKKNFLNLYFVKLGWGWTSSLLGLFICLTRYVAKLCVDL